MNLYLILNILTAFGSLYSYMPFNNHLRYQVIETFIKPRNPTKIGLYYRSERVSYISISNYLTSAFTLTHDLSHNALCFLTSSSSSSRLKRRYCPYSSTYSHRRRKSGSYRLIMVTILTLNHCIGNTGSCGINGLKNLLYFDTNMSFINTSLPKMGSYLFISHHSLTCFTLINLFSNQSSRTINKLNITSNNKVTKSVDFHYPYFCSGFCRCSLGFFTLNAFYYLFNILNRYGAFTP